MPLPGAPKIDALNGVQAPAQIDVHVVTSGRVQIDRPTTLSAQIDAVCLTTTGTFAVPFASLTTKEAM